MKILLAIFFLLHTYNSYSQTRVEDFKKYSYPLLGFVTHPNSYSNFPVSGTCFFIRYKEKIFLITSRHNVCDCKFDPLPFFERPQQTGVFILDSLKVRQRIGVDISKYNTDSAQKSSAKKPTLL